MYWRNEKRDESVYFRNNCLHGNQFFDFIAFKLVKRCKVSSVRVISLPKRKKEIGTPVR